MSKSAKLLSGRLLARNVLWNLLGTGLPLVVAIWAIPLLLRGMGTERFGLLSIVWVGVGYFSLFDLGIGRALTKLVAERLGREEEPDTAVLVTTGLRLMLILGIAAALVVGAISLWLVADLLNVSPSLRDEAVFSFLILAATLPFVITTAGYIGILQAHQKFKLISAVRVPLGLANFIGPVLALTVTPSLVATTLLLAFARVLAWLAYRAFCKPLVGENRVPELIDRAGARELLSFGGWTTITNVVGPLMVYFDRFLVGALLTLTAVAYYTTPYEAVTRVWIVSEAILSVLFPALTTALAANPQRANALVKITGRVLLIAMSVPIAIIILFSEEILTLWVGTDFASESASVMRWLAVGVFVNCFARLPFVLLQGSGRPDLIAKLHLGELPLYMLLLWQLIDMYGIVGAAAGWVIRIVVDAWALFAMGMIQVPVMRAVLRRTLLAMMVVTMALATLSVIDQILIKIVSAALVLTVSFGFAIREYLSARRGGYGAIAVHQNG